VRRSEAKTHLDPQGLSHHVGSPVYRRGNKYHPIPSTEFLPQKVSHVSPSS
jgi:hypothetical protein